MTINYGKRNPGGLSAASPGDTLYIPFSTFNDAGESVSLAGTLAVTDIEVFKNGNATARATDSGYSLISDTGQYGDRAGLYRFSVQIFNTADDTGFYDAGSQYHVAVDAVTVDSRTVRFFPAIFELGTQDVNVTRIDGDTGAADRLGKLAGLQLKTDGTFDTGTGQASNTFNVTASASVDTGVINNAIWNGVRSDHVSAGTFGQYVSSNLIAVLADTGAAHLDGGRLGVAASASSFDTGQVSNAVWNSLRSQHTGAGSFGESDTGISSRLTALQTGVNVTSLADTGVNDRLAKILADTDTGIQSGVNVISIADTGINSRFSQVTVTGFSDTGVNNRLAVILADTDTGIQSAVNLRTIGGDTGAADQLRQAFLTTPTYFQQVDVQQMDGDTGAADVLQKFADTTGALSPSGELDTGSGTLGTTAAVDTGQVCNAVWNSLRSEHTVAGSFGESDTGVNNRLAVILADTDTGIQSSVNVTAFADTGVNSRLTALQTGVHVTSFSDTGINLRLAVILADTDTGIQSSVNVVQIGGDTGAASQLMQAFATTPTYFQQVDIQQIDGDTGAADVLQKFADTNGALSPAGELDTGSGSLGGTASVDTGQLSNAVWNSLRSDHVVAGSFGESDTGINNRLAVILADTDTGIQSAVNVVSFSDTGVNARLSALQTGVNVTSFADTGVNNRLSVILADTDTGIQSGVNVTSLSDTGVNARLTLLQVGVNVTGFADTGINDRLAKILADTDTGIQSAVTVVAISDTGMNERLAAIEAKTNSLSFTVAGQVDANVQYINDVAITGTGASGDEWGP